MIGSHQIGGAQIGGASGGIVPVVADKTFSYGDAIANSKEFSYGDLITTSKTFLYGEPLAKQKPVSYSDSAVLNKQLDSDYESNAILNKQLDATYSSHPVISKQLDFIYQSNTQVQKQLDTEYASLPTVVKDFIAQYASSIKVQKQLDAEYASLPVVMKALDVAYHSNSKVQKQLNTEYSSLAVITKIYTTWYDSSVKVQKQLQFLYSDPTKVTKSSNTSYSLLTIVSKDLTTSYSDLISVAQDQSFFYSLNTLNLLTKQRSFNYTLLREDSYSIDSEVTVELNSEVILITGECLISRSEESVLWECQFNVSDWTDFIKFNEGGQFVVTFLGEEYTFVYTSKSFTRDAPGKFNGVIQGQSPAVTLTSPRVDLVTFTYETDEQIRTIVEELLGQVVDWQGPEWVVTAFRVAGENAAPLDFVKDLLNEVGLVLESKKDGTLLVRPKYPIPIIDYLTASIDQIYTDVEDNLSASLNYEPREGYNKFRVANEDVEYNDVIESVQDETDPNIYFLRVYPSPWRTTIQVVHTDGITVALNNLGWQTREEEELVEIVEGKANTQYPIESISTVEWHSTVMPLNFTQYSTEITSSTDINYGYGLVKITYVTRYLEYSTASPVLDAVQYLVEDLSGVI